MVTTEDGAPVANAQVCATCATCDMAGIEDQVCSETGNGGDYLLRSLGTNGYTVTAHIKGFATATALDGRPVYVKPGSRRENVDITLSRQGHDVHGRVLDALGGGIPQAQVRIASWGDVNASTAVTTDDSGNFEVTIGGNYVTAVASAPGYASARIYRVAPTQDLTLVLTPEAVITGHVRTEAEGRPVAGAQVVARSVMPGSGARSMTVSEPDGSFRITGLEPGRYGLRALAAGYRGQANELFEVALGQTRSGVELLVVAAAQVNGRVLVEAEGSSTPCEEGFVTLGPPHPAQALRDPKWTEEAVRAVPSPPTSVIALIGAGGRVQFDAVPEGTYFAGVDCKHHLQHLGPEVVEVGTEDQQGLVWRVIAAPRIAIRVVDDRGGPLANVPVRLRWPTRRLTTRKTNADGWTPEATHLHPGLYRASLKGGYRADPIEVDVRPDAIEVRGTIVVRGDAALEVAVRDHRDRPLDDVRVAARACPVSEPLLAAQSVDDPGSLLGHGRGEMVAVALGLGTFRLAPVPAGCYRVSVSDPLHPEQAGVEQALQLRSGESASHRIVLRRDATIEGRVLDANGNPGQDAWVSAEANGASRSPLTLRMRRGSMYAAERVLSDFEGRFRITGLDGDKSYDLRAEALNGVRVLTRNVAAGAQARVVIPEAAAVEGIVTDGDGRAIEEFRIDVIEAQTRRTETRFFSQSGGRFALSDLSPGRVELVAVDAVGQVAKLEAELLTGERLSGLHLSIPSGAGVARAPM